MLKILFTLLDTRKFTTLLPFKGAAFKSPTDLIAGTYAAILFIKMRHISVIDYPGVIFRYSCDTLSTIKSYQSIHCAVALSDFVLFYDCM